MNRTLSPFVRPKTSSVPVCNAVATNPRRPTRARIRDEERTRGQAIVQPRRGSLEVSSCHGERYPGGVGRTVTSWPEVGRDERHMRSAVSHPHGGRLRHGRDRERRSAETTVRSTSALAPS